METVKLVLALYGAVLGFLALLALAAVFAAGVVGVERQRSRVEPQEEP